MNARSTDDLAHDVIETDEHVLDLTTPPSREDVGISEGSNGLSVAVDRTGRDPITTTIHLPDGITLNLAPRRIVIDPRIPFDDPAGLTTETAPPGKVTLFFSFDTADDAGGFLTDLADQLGDNAGTLTEDYIAYATETMAAEDLHPRIARTGEVGYLRIEVVPRAGRSNSVRPAVHVLIGWDTEPDAGT